MSRFRSPDVLGVQTLIDMAVEDALRIGVGKKAAERYAAAAKQRRPHFEAWLRVNGWASEAETAQRDARRAARAPVVMTTASGRRYIRETDGRTRPPTRAELIAAGHPPPSLAVSLRTRARRVLGALRVIANLGGRDAL